VLDQLTGVFNECARSDAHLNLFYKLLVVCELWAVDIGSAVRAWHSPEKLAGYVKGLSFPNVLGVVGYPG
jgi:hypothetical protein